VTPRVSMIAVGASWGGLKALRAIAHGLPAHFRVPITFVQHRSKESAELRDLLQDCTALIVCEVEDKQPIMGGYIYLAPPDYHLLVDGDEFSLSVDEPVRFSRPSIDVFFESVAERFGPEAVGVVLTGANEDGAEGLRQIVARGGQAIVQDPRTAESPIMPRAALRAVPQAPTLPLERLTPYLISLATSDEIVRPRRDRTDGTDEVRA
jgi:two-component system, chemotaxis family, protein-glutamate methylesterase/glutaminase